MLSRSRKLLRRGNIPQLYVCASDLVCLNDAVTSTAAATSSRSWPSCPKENCLKVPRCQNLIFQNSNHAADGGCWACPDVPRERCYYDCPLYTLLRVVATCELMYMAKMAEACIIELTIETRDVDISVERYCLSKFESFIIKLTL